MTGWTSDELNKVGEADELQIASRKRDGTLRKPVTIWVVRVGDDLYVRSVNGPTAAWFRGTQDRREGHIQSGGVDADVAFADVDHDLEAAIDDAFRTKYRRFEARYVDPMVAPAAQSATIKLVPRATT